MATVQKSKSKSTSKRKSLKTGRPPLSFGGTTAISGNKPSNLSSRQTRTTIRTHHTLLKHLSKARSQTKPEQGLIAQLEDEIKVNGGLEKYQLASSIGQSGDRGGDTSRALVKWLRDAGYLAAKDAHSHDSVQKDDAQADTYRNEKHRDLRVLEVGALSTKNALNVPGMKVRRIDLRSQEKGIEEIDFMNLPLPTFTQRSTTGYHPAQGNMHKDDEWDQDYDIISLSLVVNFVPDPKGRGEMLRRTTKFFSPHSTDTNHLRRQPLNEKNIASVDSATDQRLLPALFLVLPLPCVTNSRYLDETRLEAIMSSLNYTLVRVKKSAKLYYSLWHYCSYDELSSENNIGKDKGVEIATKAGRNGRRSTNEDKRIDKPTGQTVFKKVEIRSGKDRNNFCIVLDQPQV